MPFFEKEKLLKTQLKLELTARGYAQGWAILKFSSF